MPFERRTDTVGDMDVLFIFITHDNPFNLDFEREVVLEYRFIGSNILQTREISPWESIWWDTLIRR